MSEKYEYKYIRVAFHEGRIASVKTSMTGNFSTAYQKEIEAHARDGWRFIQAFAPAIAGFGAAAHIDLIFEREVQS